MWCPEGYVSLLDLSDLFDSVADDYLAKRNVRFSQVTASNGEDDFPDDLQEEHYADFLQLQNMLGDNGEFFLALAKARTFYAWVIASALKKLKPRVCSPSGKIMVLAEDIFKHESDIGGCRWNDALTAPEIREVLFRHAYSFNRRDPIAGFLGFYYPTGIIKEYDDSTLTRWHHSTRFDVLHLQKHFAGWAICFEESNVPKDQQALVELIEYSDETKQFVREPSPADPLKFVHECVMQAYPDGKDEAWDEVKKKIGYSRRTIVRALKKYGGHDWWAAGGQPEI